MCLGSSLSSTQPFVGLSHTTGQPVCRRVRAAAIQGGDVSETNNVTIPARPGVFQALSSGLRLCAQTAGIGLPVALGLGALSGLGVSRAAALVDSIPTMSPDTVAVFSQGLLGLTFALTLYTAIQLSKHFGGREQSASSWLPALMLLPVGLSALGVRVLASGSTDYAPVALMGFVMGFHIFFGTLFGAFAVVVWVRAGSARLDGEPVRAGDVYGEARDRWLQVAVPHGASLQAVTVGMQVVVPGIFYALQYAFVDCLAVLEPEHRALNRSRRLTQKIRGYLFRVLFVWFFCWFGTNLAVATVMDGFGNAWVSLLLDIRQISPRTLMLQEIVAMFCTWWSVLTMLVIYRWRMAELSARAAVRRAKTADATS